VCRGTLQARADAAAINITLNSFGTSLNEPNMRQSDRKLLYPSIGMMYPVGTDRLSFVGSKPVRSFRNGRTTPPSFCPS